MKPTTFALRILLSALICCMVFASQAQTCNDTPVRIGIAWVPNTKAYDRVVRSIEAAGGEAVILPQMRAAALKYDGSRLLPQYVDENGVLLQQYADMVKIDTYAGTGADTLMKDIDAVVFLGGGDISPTLFAKPQPWHGIEEDNNCNAERDISEYLTMSYCLDHNIPLLGLCRGMQMLAVVSGAPLIQDLGQYFAAQGKDYHYLHRMQRDEHGERHYTPHDVTMTDTTSILCRVVGLSRFSLCKAPFDPIIRKVPSWHHQACGDVAGTPLKVTGITLTDGIPVIEAIERTDKPFALGVQFHPEEAVRMNLDGEAAASFMPLDEGLAYFRALITQARKNNDSKKGNNTIIP